MAGILVLTTDLPYFPGKMGVDFFLLRHMAGSHDVGVVAPCYDSFPTDGIANLESFLSGAYFWPRPVSDLPLFVSATYSGRLKSWFLRLPKRFRWWLLRRLLKIHHQPPDAFDKLAVLANCAPQLLRALTDRPWQVTVLIQTSIEPWLDYLPHSAAKMVYFHDVRSDYLGRAPAVHGQGSRSRKEIRAIFEQERRVTQRADIVGFVSDLDCERAKRMFPMDCEAGVAPIPVDTVYYMPRPSDWARDSRPIVLFTGHLTHPPNVDAVLFFLDEIWPLIVKDQPDAVFQAVGMAPAESVIEAIGKTPGCELHANVPDIRPYFWNAAVYVVPMRYGGGVRQKVFEAWSMQVPVVCTTMAAEGTGALSGEHCWLENEPSEFAGRVVAAIRRGGDKTMEQSAKQYVESHNSIAAAAPAFQALVERGIQVRRERPFNVLFDLRWMEIGIAGGMEQATFELISAISQLDRKNAYRIYAPRSACSEWDFPAGFKVERHYSDPISRQFEVGRSFLTNKLAEAFGMYPLRTPAMRSLSAIHKLDFDIVHSVAGYTHPDLIGFPGILTVNDLQHIHFPEFFTPKQYEEREVLYRASAERARHIICISEFTRQDLHRQYDIPLEKMSTVWIIPSRKSWQALSQPLCEQLLTNMNVTRNFFFFPAHCWHHKNHVRLLEAFQRILSELPPETMLVMTGQPFPEDHPAATIIRDNHLSTRVRHLGFRSPLEIRALFQGCLALVFPSLFEGFGIPVAEAMIAGKPVLCSNATSLPELVGNAALTFDPTDVKEIAQSMLDVATKADLRAALAAAAVSRRSLFSARRHAIETLSIYRRVYHESCGD